MDYSLPCSSINGILQARVLEWVAIPFSRGSSQSRDWIQVSRIVGRCFTIWATREVVYFPLNWTKEFPPVQCPEGWGGALAFEGSGWEGRGFQAEETSHAGEQRVKPWGLFSVWKQKCTELKSQAMLSNVENSSNLLMIFRMYFYHFYGGEVSKSGQFWQWKGVLLIITLK